MRISQRFNLQKSQAELDFVDIDPTRDTPLYVDPHLISVSPHMFAAKCHSALEGFFSYFLELMRAEHVAEARELFIHLHEPNETCFGVSQGRPSGRGVGSKQADKLFEGIRSSEAVKTGVLEHLQDCAIFVRGIERDKVSDMTTNIIRGQLIEYTQEQCKLLGIPLQPNVATGPTWDTSGQQWTFSHTDMLVLDGRPILLVPKGLVSYAKTYNLSKYHTHFVLNYVKRDQFRTNGPFVRRRRLKNGTEKTWVSKAELKESIAPAEKDFVAGFTRRNFRVFEDFKAWAADRARPIATDVLRSTDNIAEIAEFLRTRLLAMPVGNEAASAYHSLTLGILELLMYPSLSCPKKEYEIHQGRKRIDIAFDNSARSGIFWNLHQVHRLPCPYIFVECKNYGREVTNPEVDQLSGRFHPNRGTVGLLLCRSVQNRDLLIERCRDTFRDSRGLILPLMDEDLDVMLREKFANSHHRPEERRLADLVREVVLA
jgi:hypothetical protein